MKILIALCCFVLMHKALEGGIIKDIFEKAKERAVIVHEGVKHIWTVEKIESDYKKENSENGGQWTSTVAYPAEQNINENREAQGVIQENINENREDLRVTQEIPNEYENNYKSATKSIGTAVKDNKGNFYEITTEQESRANFVGGCQTGHRRTADGRCKLVAS